MVEDSRKKWFKAAGNAVLVAHTSRQIRAGAEDLKAIPPESSTDPVSGQALCRKQIKEKSKTI